MADVDRAPSSYDPSLPTNRDRARFYVGDTDMTRPLMADAEYDALLGDYAYNIALATILEALANRFSAMPDEYDEQGRIKVSWRKRGEHWMANAKRLRGEAVDPTNTQPQDDGAAIGEMAYDNTGYRPHQNTGARIWDTWRG